jgi:hypothetical protein
MKKVRIIERKSNRVIATYPIRISGASGSGNDRRYEDLAWDCAVSDSAVDPERRDDYAFKVENASRLW